MYVRKSEYARTVARNKELEEQNSAQYLVIKKLLKENQKLKAELSKYKKQYQHSMWFMEEDTLQELRDIGEI